MNIKLGMKKEDIQQQDIKLATFHPFKDIWYVVTIDDDGKYAHVTVKDGVVKVITTGHSTHEMYCWLTSRGMRIKP